MQRRGAQHEVAAYVARLRAVEQRPDQLGVGVVAAPLEAVLDGGYAAVMAVRAVGDAFAHRVVEVLGGGQVVGHAEKGSCRARGWVLNRRIRTSPRRRGYARARLAQFDLRHAATESSRRARGQR